MRLLFLILIPAACAASTFQEQVTVFPSLMYGHILTGPGASRYETTLILKGPRGGRAQIDIFNEQGEPMKTAFMDENGALADTGSSFTVMLQPGRTLLVKLQLPEEERFSEVAIHTGWATITSGDDELEATALVRVTTPQGKLLSRYLLSSEKPTRS